MSVAFKGRGRLLPSVRNLVLELCDEFIRSPDTSQQLVLAVQELLENLVKYSDAHACALEFELFQHEGQPMARIRTHNHASAAHLGQARAILERIIAAPDPAELLNGLVATSGDRKGSGLGLARLRAEAGLTLAYDIAAGCLRIEARCPVPPRSVG